jgi:capsular exopolysaccharide synthesis family protein
MLAEPTSPAAEAYRSLAANLRFATAGRVQTIGITSAAAGEGKSTTVANLAIALSEGGRRVIAIDADLRRPGLHTLFGADNGDGLSSMLVSEDMPLPLVDTAAPGVRLLPSGPSPANPLEVLASRKLDFVLSQASAQADFVVVDTAPAGALARHGWAACCWWSALAEPNATWRAARASNSNGSTRTCWASCWST